MLADFHFLRPWWLLALLPAAILLYLLRKNKFQRGDWTRVCDAELLPYILLEQPPQTRPGGGLLAVLATLSCILALAGPTWERLPGPAFRNDSALVVALDLSESMNATDIKPSRISRARYKIADILKQRKDGQTALLVYSGDAFTVTPLTTDTATINSQLEALTTDIMPSSGSNTRIALEKAVDLLRQAGLAQGHILLVTDGADANSVTQAERMLGDYKLSVLGTGTPEGAPIPQPGGGFLKDAAGNIVVAKLDLDQLSQLAAAGHGLFQTVTAGDDDIERLGALFNDAVNRENSAQTDLLLQQWDEKGPWLLLLVLPWAALRFRKGLLQFALLCLLSWAMPQDALALDWQSLWQTADQRAQQAFAEQHYDQAAEQFNNPEWRAAAQYKAGQYQQAAETLKDTQTADGHYNRGNALAKAGQLQEALQAYQQALKLDPQHADAKFNKELVDKQLQQQKQPQKQDQSSQGQQQKSQNQQPDSTDSQQSQDRQSSSGDQPQDQGPEKAQENAQSDAKRTNPQPNEDKRQQPEQQSDKPDDARRSSNNPKPEQSRQKEPPTPNNAEQEEAQRANDNALKRIPDEPTGLLKRKFKYQYGQRSPPPHDGPAW